MSYSEQLLQVNRRDIEASIESIELGDHIPKDNPKQTSYFFRISGERILQKSVWRHAFYLRHAKSSDRLTFQSAELHKWLLENGFSVFHERSDDFLSDNEEELSRETYERLARPEQFDLRLSLLHERGYRCEISGCAVVEVLEAAHIVPHSLGGNSTTANALLLRVDLHRLFDRGLMQITPEDGTVRFTVQDYPQEGFEKHLTLSDQAKDALRKRRSLQNNPLHQAKT